MSLGTIKCLTTIHHTMSHCLFNLPTYTLGHHGDPLYYDRGGGGVLLPLLAHHRERLFLQS